MNSYTHVECCVIHTRSQPLVTLSLITCPHPFYTLCLSTPNRDPVFRLIFTVRRSQFLPSSFHLYSTLVTVTVVLSSPLSWPSTILNLCRDYSTGEWTVNYPGPGETRRTGVILRGYREGGRGSTLIMDLLRSWFPFWLLPSSVVTGSLWTSLSDVHSFGLQCFCWSLLLYLSLVQPLSLRTISFCTPI